MQLTLMSCSLEGLLLLSLYLSSLKYIKMNAQKNTLLLYLLLGKQSIARGLSLLMEYRWSITSKTLQLHKKAKEYQKNVGTMMEY